MALPAPNSAASTCSRTTPRTRLAIVAAPADAAERASFEEEEGEGLGAKLAAHGVVDGAAVGVLAGKLRHDGLHHLAHVFGRARTGFGNRRRDRGVDLLRGGG